MVRHFSELASTAPFQRSVSTLNALNALTRQKIVGG